MKRNSALLLCSVIGLTAEIRPSVGTSGNWAARLREAQQHRDSQIRKMRSVRRYSLHNPRWKSDATMDVVMTWDGQSRKRFEITSMSAESFQKRVFLKLLEQEAASSVDRHEDSAISSENYAIEPVGSHLIDGRPCEMVMLRPKKKTKLTIDGRACIDLKDNAVVLMEGRTAKSLSFWVGKAEVNQQFRKVGDFWVPWHNQSTANVRLLGATRLTIQFMDYFIEPKTGAPLAVAALQQ